ncbi:DUF664 domain-containing protein [Paenarthrobacter sp. Z7-10]|nr:DUF664 domain-containing protein [Paenarthrobacter sp. Z7-10]
MLPSELLSDAFRRISDSVVSVLDTLGPDDLNRRPGGSGNSISWLIWHLTRVQDDHVAEVSGQEQVWTAGGFVDRFGFRLSVADTGYGHSASQVSAVTVDSGTLLLDYHRAVADQTLGFVRSLGAADLDRIVDERWDPPVTLGVRLISVVGDCLKHAGQAAYIRGLPSPPV